MSYRRCRACLLLALVLIPVGVAEAQSVASSTSKLAWDEPLPVPADPAGSLAVIKTYTFRHYSDGATTGVTLTGVDCVAGSYGQPVALCTAALPAYTLGSHTVAITAQAADGSAESAHSAPLTFTISVVAGVPLSLRLTP